MTLCFHEWKRGRLSFIIWTAAIAFMLGVCVLIYPEMKSQMSEMTQMFSDMGSFSDAFGLDQLNFGEFMGYFGIECGNTLGIGGALFAAVTGITALAKEEKDRTAEFLLTHPVSRFTVVTQKLLAVMTQVLAFNAVVAAVTMLGILAIGEEVEFGTVALLLLSYTLLQIEIAAVTFGISAFLKGNGLGIGMGLALMLYFLNIVSNLTEEAEFLKYITPFSYTDSAYIINEQMLQAEYLAVGAVFTVLGITAAFWKYTRKDIA